MTLALQFEENKPCSGIWIVCVPVRVFLHLLRSEALSQLSTSLRK